MIYRWFIAKDKVVDDWIMGKLILDKVVSDKSNLPLVSIVTPSYNCARFLEGNILSLQEQDYPFIQHIIVDGKSQDGTLGILQQYGDRVTWMSEPDRGMYDAINKGFALAKGEIFAYLNADDRYYAPNTVSRVVSAFLRAPAIDFTYGHCAFTNEDGKILYVYKAPIFNRKLATAFPRIIFHQPTCFWRKRVHIGFDSSFRYCGDSNFFRFLCKKHLGKNVKQIIAKFMVRKDNIASLNQRDMMMEAERVFGKLSDRKKPLYLRIIDLVYIRIFLNLRTNMKRFSLHYQGRPYL
jgi:glycosyltransferase involved in cell wall biosynthesis